MPLIVTREFKFYCPHSGLGQVPMPMQHFWRIGNGEVLLDGDNGVIQGCKAGFCVTFSFKSLNLTAVQCNAVGLGQKQAMLTTDLVLTNCGFPMVMIAPPFTVANTTVPARLFQKGDKASEFLADESRPGVELVSPVGGIAWSASATAPVVLSFSVTCRHISPAGVDVRLIANAPGGPTSLISNASSGPAFHNFKPTDDPGSAHEIIVSLTPEIRARFAAGQLILLVRVNSKRGVSGYKDVTITLVQ